MSIAEKITSLEATVGNLSSTTDTFIEKVNTSMNEKNNLLRKMEDIAPRKKTYWLSNSGNDSNEGDNKSTPVKSFNGIQKRVGHGKYIKVNLRESYTMRELLMCYSNSWDIDGYYSENRDSSGRGSFTFDLAAIQEQRGFFFPHNAMGSITFRNLILRDTGVRGASYTSWLIGSWLSFTSVHFYNVWFEFSGFFREISHGPGVFLTGGTSSSGSASIGHGDSELYKNI